MSTPRLPWDPPSPPATAAPAPGEPASPPATAGKPHQASSRPPCCAVRTAIHGSARVRLEAVRRHVLAHRLSGIRVLAPTHEQAHDVVRHVLADVPASLGVERAGWIGFSVRLATPALIARGLTPVSGLGFEAIVARVVARARETSSLTYFAEASRHPGFVPALARTLDDVRRAALPAASLDDGTTKGRDLASLLGAVEAAMGELRHADRADVLALATEAVQRDEGSDLALPLVLVDPPLASRRDVALAQALVARSRDALVTAPDGDPWVRRLIDGLATSVAVIDPADHATTPEALRRVHVGLFSIVRCRPPGGRRRHLRGVPVGARRGPRVRRGGARRARARRARHALRPHGRRDARARAVRQPSRDRAAPRGRASVLRSRHAASGSGRPRHARAARVRRRRISRHAASPSTSPSGRSPAIGRDASAGRDRSPSGPPASLRGWGGRTPRRGVPTRPCFPTRRRRLGSACRMRRHRLTPARTTPRAPMPMPTAEADGDRATPGRSPWRWEAILNDAQVIGGADRWERRLRGHREHLKVRADAAFKDDPSSPRHEFLTRQVTWTDELIAFAADVVGEMASWPAVDDWGGWLARLRRLAPRVLARPDRVHRHARRTAAPRGHRRRAPRRGLRRAARPADAPVGAAAGASLRLCVRRHTRPGSRARLRRRLRARPVRARVPAAQPAGSPAAGSRTRAALARPRDRRGPRRQRTPPAAPRGRGRVAGAGGLVRLDGDRPGATARAVLLRHRRAARRDGARARLRGAHAGGTAAQWRAPRVAGAARPGQRHRRRRARPQHAAAVPARPRSRHRRPCALPVRPQSCAAPRARRATSATVARLDVLRWPRRAAGGPGEAPPAGPGLLGVGAPAVRHVPVSVLPLDRPAPRASRGGRAPHHARPADARIDGPRDARGHHARLHRAGLGAPDRREPGAGTGRGRRTRDARGR